MVMTMPCLAERPTRDQLHVTRRGVPTEQGHFLPAAGEHPLTRREREWRRQGDLLKRGAGMRAALGEEDHQRLMRTSSPDEVISSWRGHLQGFCVRRSLVETPRDESLIGALGVVWRHERGERRLAHQ